jgi:hypothetical protein
MTAQLNIDATTAQRVVSPLEVPQNLSFDLIGPLHPQRTQVEAAIAQRFADVYGADIRHFMPLQLCAHVDGEMVATLGIRQAQQSSLFLENYFDQPVERFASAITGQVIKRCDVVEIGNLASSRRGASQWLFVALTLLLCEQQQPWVTFTATPEVQKLLRRLNITPRPLTNADADRLGADKYDWGNYYAQKPLVMITHAPTAKQKLLAHPLMVHFVAQLAPSIQKLQAQWPSVCGDNTVRTEQCQH